MEKSRSIKYYNELDDQAMFDEPAVRGHRSKSARAIKAKKAAVQDLTFILAQDDSRKTQSMTYQAARFEQGWLLDSLGHLFEQQWISDVVSKIKVGKEASVYLCRSGDQVQEPLLAVKIYRPSILRSLKNDHLYRLGRAVLDEDEHQVKDPGMLKALHQKSGFGVQVQLQSWIAHEFKTLKRLQAAEADVPRVYAMGQSAILMDYLGDEDQPAPTLNSVNLKPGQVKPLYERMIDNIRIMLGLGIVHADLSAYNVLYQPERITLIDFPQVIQADSHPAGYALFQRDVRRICDYFASQGLPCNPDRLAEGLWREAGLPRRDALEEAVIKKEI